MVEDDKKKWPHVQSIGGAALPGGLSRWSHWRWGNPRTISRETWEKEMFERQTIRIDWIQANDIFLPKKGWRGLRWWWCNDDDQTVLRIIVQKVSERGSWTLDRQAGHLSVLCYEGGLSPSLISYMHTNKFNSGLSWKPWPSLSMSWSSPSPSWFSSFGLPWSLPSNGFKVKNFCPKTNHKRGPS